MPIVATADGLIIESGVISLARYAQIIGYAECAFFGVNAPGNVALACRTIWTLEQRRNIAKYLAEAQSAIEDVVRYPLSPKWFVNEEHDLRCPVMADWTRIIAAGVRAESVIEEGATVVLSSGNAINDPASIAVATSVTNADEIHIYHPDSQAEIFPSSIAISGGTATIEIPRCRLVADQDNPPEGWEYADDANFLDEVDVRRVYNDPSTNATLVTQGGTCNCGSCSEEIGTACMFITDKQIGAVSVRPATYTGAAWLTTSTLCRGYARVRLNYLAGLTTLSPLLEDAIVRLAHAKMPNEPCGCDVAQGVWKRDRNIPDLLTRERINNDFGLSDGAWAAWQIASSKKLLRAGVL